MVVEEGMSIIYVAIDDKVIGWIGFKDTVRKNAANSIKRL